MDEITKAFKIARAHFNDAPVWSLLYLRWSKEYQPYHFADDIAWSLRFARRWDSRPVIRLNSPVLWREMVAGTHALWERV